MDGGQAMERRAFLVMVSGGIVAAPLATEAQLAGKVVKIGVLHPGSGTQQLFTALAEIGYVEGRNVVIERRYAEGRVASLNEYTQCSAGASFSRTTKE